MFKQTSKQMQRSSWPESGRHLWLFSSRLSKHTLQTLQWNDLSLWILRKRKNWHRIEKFRIHFYHNVNALQTFSTKFGTGQKAKDKPNHPKTELNKQTNKITLKQPRKQLKPKRTRPWSLETHQQIPHWLQWYGFLSMLVKCLQIEQK